MTLGTVFGFLALARKISLDQRVPRAWLRPGVPIPTSKGCTSTAVASNISFAVGILGLGAGGALLLLYPEGPQGEALEPGPARSASGRGRSGDVGVRGPSG